VEKGAMAKRNVKSLEDCVNNTCVTGDVACATNCETVFMTGEGNTVVNVSGGKVFKDTVGGKVFINNSGVIGSLPPGV
jgi:hypothetical protein